MSAAARRTATWLGLMVALLACPGVVAAQSAGTDEEAQRLYVEGRQLLEAGDLVGALAKLQPSFAMQKSPNTELLMAHALRRLGRKPEAMATYLRVLDHAGERVAKGENRYSATVDDAGRWVARLRTELAEVEVAIVAAPEGTQVQIDGTAAPATRRGADLVLTLWREPGPISVRAATPDGRSTARQQNAPAARTSVVHIDLTPGAAAAAPAFTAASTPSSVPPADDGGGPPAVTWIAGGVAIAALGTFAAFGALSLDNAAEADRCSPGCPPSLTDEGQRNQTIANVALGVGAAAATVAVVAWIIDATTNDTPPTARRGSRARPRPLAALRF